MERLTDDRFLKDGFYQPKSKEEEKEIRSMGNNLTFEKLYKHCAEVEKQNAELQKQVDELKNRFENKACCNMSENCSMIQQAVKDTAKEILQELLDFTNYETFRKGYELVKIKRKLKEIAKSKGVEVE